MKWIDSGGGPLICLPKKFIMSWGGIDFLTTESTPGKSFQNDYERACCIDSYIGRISLTNGEGFVLGDEPMMTSVAPRPFSGIQVVRIVYCNSVEEVELLILSDRVHSQLQELGSLILNTHESEWCMFDSAFPGSLAEEGGLTFAMPMGKVRIETYDYQPNEHTSLIIHDISASVE